MPSPETDIVQSRIAVPGVSGGTTPGDFQDVLNRLAALEGLAVPVTRGVTSGYYYGPLTTLSGYALAGASLSQNYLWAAPFLCPANATFNQVGVEVVTAAVAGGTILFGIYGIGPDGLPANLIASLGSVATTATGYRPSPAISLTLSRGLYWIAGATNQAVSVRQMNGTGMTAVVGQSGTNGTIPVSALARSLTPGFTSLPSTFGTPTSTIYVPAFQLRAA